MAALGNEYAILQPNQATHVLFFLIEIVLIEIVVNIYKQGDLHKSRGTCFFLFFLEKSKEVTVTLGSLSWVVTLELG